ncbi:alpha-N-acetylglucosaminidase [Parapedobacter tibetensis]|uniref:alpha-N-acetylglucosaminidase n=1 Tax=Parapedobacter tibetensis TaxID=2972951 RepID=UPI00214D77B9|nr:alpha-N-acetylglucosaminidase [Parapedobacter tibetensis]
MARQQEYQQAAGKLLARIIPRFANFFDIEIIPSEGNDVFEIESDQDRITLRGNTPVSIGSALNWYLKYHCHCHVSWNGDNLNLPTPLPPVKSKIRHETPFKHRVYLNFCTFSYSMPWWNWDRWQREIDWMALHGINMPLAVTGQEAVWQATLRKLGMEDHAIRRFLAAPSYSAWQLMDNLEGWGGPLPQGWIDSHLELGQRILTRQRELGMTPILKGFSGYVPLALADLYPEAKIERANWISTFDTANLDPLDPAFAEIGKTFLQEQYRLLGTDHYYSVDPFHESTPPISGVGYLEKAGAAIFETLRQADPQAMMAIQTWSLREGLLRSVPRDRTLMLSITGTNWKKHDGYWGRPWIVGMMHNYGGRTYTGGNLRHFISHAGSLIGNPAAGNVQGIGLFPEAIEHNPIIYEAASEVAWHKQAPDLSEWVQQYARARYGQLPEMAAKAWEILLDTVYQQKKVKIISMESPICARPALEIIRVSMNGEMVRDYDMLRLWEGWQYLLECQDTLDTLDTYQYDLVDVARQCMADLSILLHEKITLAYQRGDRAKLQHVGHRFIQLMDDMDELLATRPEFLLGKWIEDARSWGEDDAEKDQYERNARSIITVWGPETPNALFFDYSNRQWAGLIADFYKPRWEKFLACLLQQPAEGEKRYREKRLRKSYNRPANDANDFFKALSAWEHAWTHETKPFSAVPTGNPIKVATRLYDEWFTVMSKLMTDRPFIQQADYLKTIHVDVEKIDNFGL